MFFSLQDLTLEKIEELFAKPLLERANVPYYLCCGLFGSSSARLTAVVNSSAGLKDSIGELDRSKLCDSDALAVQNSTEEV